MGQSGDHGSRGARSGDGGLVRVLAENVLALVIATTGERSSTKLNVPPASLEPHDRYARKLAEDAYFLFYGRISRGTAIHVDVGDVGQHVGHVGHVGQVGQVGLVHLSQVGHVGVVGHVGHVSHVGRRRS